MNSERSMRRKDQPRGRSPTAAQRNQNSVPPKLPFYKRNEPWNERSAKPEYGTAIPASAALTASDGGTGNA